MEKSEPNIIITVEGIPWEQLTEEHRQKIIRRNTDIVADIVTREVIRMAQEGSTTDEIRKFLKLDENFR